MKRIVSVLSALGVLSLAASGALAGPISVNFDEGTSPFAAWGGTPVVSSAQAHSGPNSLFLAAGSNALLTLTDTIDDVTFTPVPEPVTLTLLDLGGALALARRNRK